ncbi:MAG: RNA methyltransferase [Arenicellales bacterium WSBS_2016_MAG_OTU3]
MTIENRLSRICVVLARPTHAGNIGATARVMRNMGLKQLALVAPRSFPDAQATARASGADDVLENALVVDTLDEALAECSFVVGTSARKRSVSWPAMPPEEAMRHVYERAESEQVAILFGQEKSGLKNEELDRCHQFVRIPVDEDFTSLNLGTSVAMLAWELRKQFLAQTQVHTQQQAAVSPAVHIAKQRVEYNSARATTKEMRGFYKHLNQVLYDIDFIGSRPSEKLLRKLVRVYNRAELSRDDLNILRGILTSTQKAAGKKR